MGKTETTTIAYDIKSYVMGMKEATEKILMHIERKEEKQNFLINQTMEQTNKKFKIRG